MRDYLKATGRSAVAAAADKAASQGFLSADEGAEYDDVIEIVSSIFHLFFALTTLLVFRIYLNWNPLSTAHLLPTSLHPFLSSANL